jgi:thiol-disulfide isomerase/thioredoxin
VGRLRVPPRPRWSPRQSRVAQPIIILLALAAGCAGEPRPAQTAGATPDFRDIPVVSLEGRPSSLSSVLGKRPALVSFWAPWCEPCVRELPDLERLARTVSPCGASVLGVAVGERHDAIGPFCRARGVTYPQVTDEDYKLADALGQRRIPATIVLDAAGRVIFTGDALDARARTALAQVLDGPDAQARCKLP